MHQDPRNDITVRLVEPDEYQAAGELVVEAYITGGILSDDRGYDAILRDVRGRSQDATVLVAIAGNQVVGTGTIALAGTEHAEIAHDSEAEFRYFGVRTDMWGRGIGAALVGASEAAAVHSGATSIVMSVIAHNAAALAMYQKCGYRRVEERDWSPFPDIELLVLRKSL